MMWLCFAVVTLAAVWRTGCGRVRMEALVSMAGDTGGLKQGSKGREAECGRYIGSKNNKP